MATSRLVVCNLFIDMIADTVSIAAIVVTMLLVVTVVKLLDVSSAAYKAYGK